ncbi:MAG: hypothetical protein IJ562_00105 [Prevotella sp.]|nr:hypothetical protein [Prevotella sp.]
MVHHHPGIVEIDQYIENHRHTSRGIAEKPAREKTDLPHLASPVIIINTPKSVIAQTIAQYHWAKTHFQALPSRCFALSLHA